MPSRIFEAMEHEGNALAPDVTVHLLEPEAFFQRYVEAAALGDTVIRVWSSYPASTEWVIPNDDTIRMQHWERDRERAIASNNPTMLRWTEQPPRPASGPLPHDEVELRVRAQLQKLERAEQLDHHPLRKVSQVARYLIGGETDYVPQYDRISLKLPAILSFWGTDKRIHEVAISLEAEKKFDPKW